MAQKNTTGHEHGTQLIEGVRVKKLNVIPDDRGRLMEILRADDAEYEKFGQVYMTTAYPGIVKAWHFHKLQTDNFTCVKGTMLLALYDARDGSRTHSMINEFVINLDNPALVHIPPGIYHGFKCIGDEEAVVINTVTEPYKHAAPDEYRVDAHDGGIGYDWNKM